MPCKIQCFASPLCHRAIYLHAVFMAMHALSVCTCTVSVQWPIPPHQLSQNMENACKCILNIRNISPELKIGTVLLQMRTIKYGLPLGERDSWCMFCKTSLHFSSSVCLQTQPLLPLSMYAFHLHCMLSLVYHLPAPWTYLYCPSSIPFDTVSLVGTVSISPFKLNWIHSHENRFDVKQIGFCFILPPSLLFF